MYKLTPKIHPIVADFIEEKKCLNNIIEKVGLPLNLLFPDVLSENLKVFTQNLEKFRISYKIFFAHKTNQSNSFVKQAAREKIFIDVASVGELESAIRNGFTAENIEITGPKGIDLLSLSIKKGILINVDNIWELEEIIKLSKLQNKKTNILLRLSGFKNSPITSRFGIPIKKADEAFKLIIENNENVNFLGFAYHLDTNDVKEKVSALNEILGLFEYSFSKNLTPTVINIGGGLRQVFIEDRISFDEYIKALKDGLNGRQTPLTWQDLSFGYYIEDNIVKGIPVFHKFSDTTPGVSYLNEILESDSSENRPISKVLRENQIELYIEPGKSLVDHAGITVAMVEFVKEASNGSLIVNLNLKRDNLVPVDQEIMLDPVIIYRGKKSSYKKGEFGVYFAGNLCLERDMIYNHKTFINKLPQPGDLVIFINTAAYQMDLSASNALMNPTPKKVSVIKKGEKYSWELD